MSRITQFGATAPFGLFKNDTTADNVTYTGQKFDLADGREVTLVSVGGSNIVSGVLVQGSAIVADNQNIAVAANAAVGATSITVTLGATAVTANQYAGGFVVINAGSGIGQTLQIASHPAASGAASLVITLSDAVQVAITSASSKACLIASPYEDVVINPTTPTATPVGVTLYPLTASAYGYVVSKGIVSCLADGNPAVGAALSSSNATAGAVESGVIAQGFVGRALQAGVTTESRAIFVDL